MKKSIASVVVSAALLLGSQVCQAGQYDDPACFSKCDANYSSCTAGVINQPEPRTYDEQSILDTCRQTFSECQHGCEENNAPVEAPPQPEENK